jgi:hypothetical protein
MKKALGVVALAILAYALPPVADLVGLQIAGSVWQQARMTSPWLSQTGEVLGGGVGGLVLAAVLRALRLSRFWPPVWGALAVGAAYGVWPPAALLVSPIAAGAVAALQTPSAGVVRGAALSGALAGMAHLLPFPPWARIGLCAAAGVAAAAPVRARRPVPSS